MNAALMSVRDFFQNMIFFFFLNTGRHIFTHLYTQTMWPIFLCFQILYIEHLTGEHWSGCR